MKKSFVPVVLLSTALVMSGCAKKTVRYLDRPVPARSSLAVIVKTKHNQVKNVVAMKLLKAGYSVKAMNYADMYTNDQVYDIRDFKKVSYRNPKNNSLLSMEKTFNSIYKLHIYNYELNKAETLQEIRKTWNVDYLMILDFKDWGKTSWGRVVDLRNMEIVWVENFKTRQTDNVESMVDHVIKSISKK